MYTTHTHTCASPKIPECSGFNSAGYLKAFPRNASVDSYISKNSCGVHGKANITEGSCLHKGRHWQFVHCHDAQGNIDTWFEAKARFNLPPNLIAEACKVDPACTVRNERLRDVNSAGIKPSIH